MRSDARVPARRWGGRWALFVRRYGWRAYAVPILSAITVVALLHGSPARSPQSTARAAAGSPAPSSAITRETDGTGTGGTVQVEGSVGDDAAFAAGATPAPVVVNLGDDGVSCATNTYRSLVLVSIRRQHLWACQGGRQLADTPVTTGATTKHNQTPLGSWRVQARQQDRYLVGPGYKDYVRYWVPFNGDFGLHDASWQTMPFGSKNWPTQGSHGCVHIPTGTMAWLYRWITVGSTVVTVER